tara:strand:- start:448 stop:642 length:195 start_codon:yes stop_codon:yes gene_type:complete
MYKQIYKWFKYSNDDIRVAQNQVDSLEKRKIDIDTNENLTNIEKAIKTDRIELSIMSIKYTFCL